jgi:hypothetical protein
MRRLALIAGLIVVSSLTLQTQAQVWVTNTGFASDRMIWGIPNVPLISTPIIDLQPSFVTAAGATNATAENTAGASNATLENYGPEPVMSSRFGPHGRAIGEPEGTPGMRAHQHRLDMGGASFESAYDFPDLGGQSLAEVTARARQYAMSHRAKRTFTNDDVNRVKQQQEQRENTQHLGNQPKTQ